MPATDSYPKEKVVVGDYDPKHYLKINPDGSINVQGGSGGTGVPVIPSPYSGAASTAVAANVGAVTLLAANANRRDATVYYDGAAILYLLEGSGTPSSTNFTVKLGTGYYTFYETPPGFTGALQGIWSVATGSANMTELS